MNPPPTTGAASAPEQSVEELPSPPVNDQRRILRALSAPLALAGTGLVAGTYLYLNNPNISGSIFPKCPLKLLTGLDCPGCGLTRSLYALLHGDLVAAASHNLLVLFVVPWVVMALVRWTAQRFGHDIPKLFIVKQWMVPATVILLTIFTVARNIPVAPVEWLNSGYFSV